MASIYKIHQQLLKRLIIGRETDSKLFFVPRKNNNSNRLSRGYWFLGNDSYVFLRLWEGMDWKERTGCIGFVVLNDGRCWIELSAQGCPEVIPFFEKLIKEETGFTKAENKNKWYKYFNGNEYLDHFKYFISFFKPKVDKLIDTEHPPHIAKLTFDEFDKYGNKVILLYNKRKSYTKTHKITRLSWNDNNWRYPSGWEGKSKDLGTHEGKYGFGFEEWLFDYSKMIDGYKYGFIRGFESKKEIHASKIYELQLYTQNSFRNYYHVGFIKRIEGIGHSKSVEVYKQYEKKGWLNDMFSAVKTVNAKKEGFTAVTPEMFFNVRFKSSDVHLLSELIEIANVDDVITTDRFKLLGFVGNLEAVENVFLEEGKDHEGNLKNTDRIKRTFKPEQEFDPYHNYLQNALTVLLREDKGYGYSKVDIEKSRVDVKAFTPEGECHYFEIKTAGAKQNVREALGQVMEYAYYPNSEMAKKLYVVGDEVPDEKLMAYLIYLRERFNIPVFYRHFDPEANLLSIEY